MTVYEFIKKAQPDLMALEIGRMILGACVVDCDLDKTDERLEGLLIKYTAVAMAALEALIDEDFYKNPTTMEFVLKAKAAKKKILEKIAEEDEGT